MEKKTVVEYRVAYVDTDAMGVMNHGNYLAVFERARNELMRETGYTYREFEADGFALPVVRAEVRYRRPARYDDLLETTAWVRLLKGPRLEIAYETRRKEDGALLATGSTTHAFVSMADFRPRLPPARIVAALGGDHTAAGRTRPQA